MWHDEWHSFLWVWMPFRGSLSLFWRETHTKGLRARFPIDRKRTEGGSRQRKADNRSRQNIPGESSEQGSRQKRAEARACGLRGRVGQCERMSQRSWWLCGNFTQIHNHTSPQIHRKLHKSVTNSSLLMLRVRVCLFSFLPPSRLCMLCFVCLQRNVKYPWPEMSETTRRSDSHEWFRSKVHWIWVFFFSF